MTGQNKKLLIFSLQGSLYALYLKQIAEVIDPPRLSPIPSAQLFEAAGLAGIRLVHFTAAFFAGRVVSYSIYAASAKGIEKTSVGGAFKHYLTSPIGIGLEVLMLGLLVALMQVDWAKRFGGKHSSGES